MLGRSPFYRTAPQIRRHELRQPDGRRVYLYGDFEPPPRGYQAPRQDDGVYQQRWNPLRKEWVLVARVRRRARVLRQSCPLCPSRLGRPSEIPASRFELAVFEERFPAMRQPGACETVVYSQRHPGSLASLDRRTLHDLVEVWTDRYRDLGSRPKIRYVFVFENRGEAVGMTLHHPHGQIYGYPFVPPVAAAELAADRAHKRRFGTCLQCSLMRSERIATERVLFADGGMLAYVPSYARWPHEVHVAPVHHYGALSDLPASARTGLGDALQRVARTYDRLFGVPMPYVMAMHQRPTDGRPHPEAHLHVEFYPVLRGVGRRKYLAGGECGAGTFVSDGLPEEKAAELKRLLSYSDSDQKHEHNRRKEEVT